MFVRSVLSSYSRLLAGVSLALMATALAGCNDTVAQKAEPPRPVLVATAHYDAETPERSFVGTIKPRIESDLGFRVAGKVAKRLVEVGQTVEIGQPLATLDEVDLKLQAEQAVAEQTAATGVLAQAAAAEQRAKDLKAKGWTTDAAMDSSRAAADEARARLDRAIRSVELTQNSLSDATLLADARGVVTAARWSPRARLRSVSPALPKRKRSSRFLRRWSDAPSRAPPASLSGRSQTRSTSRSCARSHRLPILPRAPILQSFRCPRLATRSRSA